MNKNKKQEIFNYNFFPKNRKRLKPAIFLTENRKGQNRSFSLCAFPKNRKGFLLGEETIKIVIAVIGIVFLIALLASIYFSVTDNQKMKEAQAIVNGENGLAKELNRINLGGEPKEQGFFIPNPSDWYLFSFAGEMKKPNLCAGDNCFCICGNVLVDVFDSQIKECDNKGICAVVSNLKEFQKIKIEKTGVFISIKKVNDFIEVSKK